ncbi:DUF262 domain-containing protein [Gimesia maris]|uniref:DUF262 domain-containing protein n=1 Tax=Gimesia maris TaxID=122 RepID=UPI003A91EDC0
MSNQFSEDDIELEEEPEEDDVTINYDIASYPSDFTLAGLSQMWKDQDISIPDFQREYVWSIRQASLLIDSFLSGLPVPPVFFYIDDENKNLVIDGQQRILSIVFFFDGYFGKESVHGKRQVFRLTGLGEDSPYHKKRYEDLTEAAQRKLRQAVLRSVNIRQLSPSGDSTSAYHIFERLNTNGTPLKPQEIRNVVFRGNFNKLLKEANKDANWRIILGRPYLDKHQKDIELLLRIFSLVGASDEYEKPMKEFLNISMKKHCNAESKKVLNFFKVFPKVTELIATKLGEKPFHLRGPLNVSALDSVVSVMIEDFRKVKKDRLNKNYSSLKDDDAFLEHTSYNTTDSKTVRARFYVVRKYLLGK